MLQSSAGDVYLPHEIARAARVPLEQVVAALGGIEVLIGHDAAVHLGRRLARTAPHAGSPRRPLFTAFYTGLSVRDSVREKRPFVVTSIIHVCVAATAVALVAAGRNPSSEIVQPLRERAPEDVRLVFVAENGPGGGGGGGGLRQPLRPAKAESRGRVKIGNPLERKPPAPAETASIPPLAAEPFPVVVAPIAPAAAGPRSRLGVIESDAPPVETHGAGRDGGVGQGTGAGVGAGQGSGLGEGMGGGTGGGVYRAGSGVEPPRILREVKASYPDEARRRRIEGEVVIELIVLRDGSVGDARIVRRLGAALDDRALEAVKQWRFAPGTFRGAPVDVAVEVVVEFKLR